MTHFLFARVADVMGIGENLMVLPILIGMAASAVVTVLLLLMRNVRTRRVPHSSP